MAYFDGSIHSVPEAILQDIEVLVDYAVGCDEWHVVDAAARLEAYVRNYRVGSQKNEEV